MLYYIFVIFFIIFLFSFFPKLQLYIKKEMNKQKKIYNNVTILNVLRKKVK